MPDPIRPSTPSPRPASEGSAPVRERESMRDRLGEIARARAPRPRAILVLYATIALFAVVYFVGTLAGWWGSPVADKVRARRERDARESSPPAPAVPPGTGEAPVPTR